MEPWLFLETLGSPGKVNKYHHHLGSAELEGITESRPYQGGKEGNWTPGSTARCLNHWAIQQFYSPFIGQLHNNSIARFSVWIRHNLGASVNNRRKQILSGTHRELSLDLCKHLGRRLSLRTMVWNSIFGSLLCESCLAPLCSLGMSVNKSITISLQQYLS